MRSPGLGGIWVVLITPFTPQGDLDEGSLAQEIQWVMPWGIEGVVALGLASEVYTLTEEERRRVLSVVDSITRGHCRWVAGVEHTGHRGALERAQLAAEFGASAVMAYPPYLVKPTDQDILSYYKDIHEQTGLPIIVQDAQPWTQVNLTPALLEELAAYVAAVKIESPPTGSKISALRHLVPDLTILGGSGGLYAYEEMMRGVDGFLIGPTQAEDFVKLWQYGASGAEDQAALLYQKLLPGLITAMTTLDTYIALQKELLAQRGIIASSTCRLPHRPLDTWQRRLGAQWLGLSNS